MLSTTSAFTSHRVASYISRPNFSDFHSGFLHDVASRLPRAALACHDLELVM
ncbi:hypothetical protein AG1IA_05293 [Rhizoctonia solani AG-1 IA]|uniref:Uncharacterized protein n=1 Tax=Thanatephorus cucumeris (strain AG1-IA) TaxID=983506 RepID=L8WV53_THACA|nr:hypothetical protein AG1IA_05293 [Rhizoctonia solani AG-1 IA]